MGGQQRYTMQNTKMISVGLLLVLFFNGCWSQDSDPMNPFDVPAIKVLFRCDGLICPVGQDCITVGGTPRCADPCKHYSVLNDTWRANDHLEDLSDPHCDDEVNWRGWYRMYLGDVSVRMPERCQPIKMCGTHAPSFLVQPHPKVGDGVQQHTICATWENGCCKFNLNPIHVKACAGNYVVYKFVNPQDCRVAYCADVNTKVCATCGENEACVSDDKITYRCEERVGKSVPEPADDGTPLNPFAVPAIKELFRCNGQVCPPGQDCISVDGTPRCADPCQHYSVLNDTWRANNHFEDLSDPHCDDEVDWMGWYRMYLGDISYRMPERCQPIKMCGTHAPSFLVQPHPKVGDGVQKHTICATWENGCCKFHLNPIHVKACAGNYVIYKLVNPQDCRVGYCADVNTKVCATCGENEDCVSDNKITFRCEKRAGNSVPEPADDGTPLNPFDVPATKVLFRCDGRVCPPSQDCISVTGTPRCADPCQHYSVLNDSWRANNHLEDLSDPHCDDEVDWMGWYRMYLGDISYRMPERCQPIKMCGTHAPSFLVQPHPQVGDGVQKHTICATWENGCCKFNLNPIHVKACPGNYVVYKLVNPQDCRVAYCADVNTKVCESCAENEACVSDDKITYRCEKRADMIVPEAADDGSAINPFDVPALKVLFRCDGHVCPPDQDCISVGGVPRCADPCLHYSVLNDTWRANDHMEDLSDPHCDDEVDWMGWYRMFLGDVSVQMPERCQPIKSCGTHAPSFLVQPHPRVGDGVQKHTICATWENGCCKFHLNPIHVKACPGNYVVYKLVNPQDCRVAYCADVKTKVCATCGDGLDCVSDDKIEYRCEQRDIQDISIFMTPEHVHEEIIIVEQLDSFRVPNTKFTGEESQDPHAAYGFSITIPKMVCGPKFMDIGLKLEEVLKAGLDLNTARMVDTRCFKGAIVNGRKWFRMPRTDGACGNTVKSNSTHAIFSNRLFMDPLGSKKTQVLPLDLPFSCFYPLGTEASLDVAVASPMAISAPPAHKHRRAVAPPAAPGIASGVGPEPRLVMSLYKGSTFEEVFPPGPLHLPLGLIMYVGVAVEDVKEKEIVVVLEDCFQTHTPDFNDPISDPLITRKCTADFILVAVLETAQSHQGRFSTLLVTFPGGDHQIYLHCSVSLCDTRTTSCKPTCGGRRFGRSAPPHHHHKHVTIGPITLEKN